MLRRPVYNETGLVLGREIPALSMLWAPCMCEEWMPAVRLPLTRHQFDQLPRHPSYAFEYLNGQAWLTPMPKFYHAVLDLDGLRPSAPPEGVFVRHVEEKDISDLEHLFSSAFEGQQPFSSLNPEERLLAARDALMRCRSGGDGPWMRQSSFIALKDRTQAVGAILLTLLPDNDASQWESFHWQEPPPPDAIERGIGRPHVTWIFVSSGHTGKGVGTTLLTASIRSVLNLGFRQLASTFMLGNESSMLWHWRNGFQLQRHCGSQRSKKSVGTRH
jgi:GNAT superfamily N-acetyltransferase